jgi:L,D-transpeptidase ErfK/SrfK
MPGDKYPMKLYVLSVFIFLLASGAAAQPFVADIDRDSARSDKLTGGRIRKTALGSGESDLKITINVPAFQMTLWQNDREVRSYPIGIGKPDWPIYIGRREASSIEWNPVWIPPSSEWIEKSVKVKAGEIILPTDPRNPLGKVKIPLGYGYLLHQAKGPADMGSLVSHGCVRVLQKDLYDLAEKIIAARQLPVTALQIAAAKRSKETLTARLDPKIPVEITYDTLVVESGRLHIYPDVYGRKKNTVENLRRELRTSGVDDTKLTDAALRRMLVQASGKRQYVVNIRSGRLLASGRAISVLADLEKPASRSSRARRR